MTRINFLIEPVRLCDQHLLAEIRELPRIANMLAKRLGTYHCMKPNKDEQSYVYTARVFAQHRRNVVRTFPNGIEAIKAYVLKDKPAHFSLGIGTMTFFLDKGIYLRQRYDALQEEAALRGFTSGMVMDNRLVDLPLGFYEDITAEQRNHFFDHQYNNLMNRIWSRGPLSGPRYARVQDEARFVKEFGAGAVV